MATNYWSKFTAARLSRRRMLAASGGAALGAAFLAACGDDDDEPSTGQDQAAEQPEDKSGLLVQPVDETDSLKRGGTLSSVFGFNFTTFIPYQTNVGTLNMLFNQFLRMKGGYMAPLTGELTGDLAESWEFSPDKLQLTFRLTDKAHFAPIPPVDGRQMTADDVLFSWDLLKEVGTRRADVANEINPSAPITSITAPDDRTVVVGFNEPLATALHLFANWTRVSLFIVPRVQDISVLEKQFIGTGVWYLDEFVPDVRVVFKANPGFGQDERNVPYMDAIEQTFVPEYATGLAQFKTGALHQFDVRGEDVLSTKGDVPELEMMATDVLTDRWRNTFGYGPGSPFLDERVRLAWSHTWDRDLHIDVMYNVDKFEAEGLPMQRRWNTSIQAESWEGWWLDPQNDDFGPNAKFFKQDLAEAKKLLSAAGHADGLDVDFHYSFTGGYGAAYRRSLEVLQTMVRDSGLFNINNVDVEFGNEFRPKMRAGGSDWVGVSSVGAFSAGLDPVVFLRTWYHSQGSMFRHFDANGVGDHSGDPKMDELLDKMQVEFDDEQRREMVREFQRYDASKMYNISYPGGSNGFELAWPALRNRMVWRGPAGRPEPQRDFAALWLDQTRPPFQG